MKQKHVLAVIAGVIVAMNLSSCAVYKQNAQVICSEYTVSTVTPTSAGDKNANYVVLEPVTATSKVEYTPGGLYLAAPDRKIYIDGQLIYDYVCHTPNEEGQWLKSFNAQKLELGFLPGLDDKVNVTHPEPKALARQLAYAKIFKRVIEVGGDAITTPVISIEVDGNVYTTTIRAYIIKLHPAK